MKSKIRLSFAPDNNEIISKAVLFKESSFAVLLNKYPLLTAIEIIGVDGDKKRIELNQIPEFENTLEHYELFTFQNKLALLNYDKIILWKDAASSDDYTICRIFNPIPGNQYNSRKRVTHLCNHLERGSSFWGVSSYGSPQYSINWGELTLTDKSFLLGFKKIKGFEWSKDFPVLPPQYFPETWGRKYHEDHLIIKNIIAKNDQIQFYTVGGSQTTLKSGPKYEFSKVGIFDYDMNFIRVCDIERGKGFVSEDNSCFIIHKHEGKRKLLFYETSNFQIFDQLSLTPVQNLGSLKSINIQLRKHGDSLLVFSHLGANLCALYA